MGRKLIHDTPEKQAAARSAARAKHKATTKNLTIDADLVAAINAAADQLASDFGFRPSQSQTLRYLLKKALG